MNQKAWLALLTVGILSGGITTSAQKLYPVEGPLAAHSPAPVYTVNKIAISGIESLSKKISVDLANGEVASGIWTIEKRASSADTQMPGTAASYPPQPNLAFAWDTVYGQGFYVARVLGGEIGQAVLKGNKGTIIQLEFLYRNRTFGVAVDNKGNIYKLI